MKMVLVAQEYKKEYKIWIVGFGNEYREDDAAGIILAQKIYKFLNYNLNNDALNNKKFLYKIDLCLEHQLLPELADELDVDLAIFCDADTKFYSEGFLIKETFPEPRLDGFNIHSIGPEWLLALAAQTGRGAKKAILVSVSGERFDFSDTPTQICLERIEKAEQAFCSLWPIILSKF